MPSDFTRRFELPESEQDILKSPHTVVIVTVTGVLAVKASLTINWTTYEPARSGVKVGETLVGAERVAVLPTGLLLKVHA